MILDLTHKRQTIICFTMHLHTFVGTYIYYCRKHTSTLSLPSLTVLSLWLLEWSGMSRSREWWECECLALRLSASAAVSVLPLRVNLPDKHHKS